VWNTFIAGALDEVLTAGQFTPDGNLTVTRIEVYLQAFPKRCRTNAVIEVTDGTPGGTITLALAAASNSTGPVTINYSAGVRITVGVSTSAGGCTVRDANVLVQYKGR